MKKLIKDTCKKTGFAFDNDIYEQIDGVSMGSPLVPVLANIIMNELESTIIKKLFDTGKVKFYCRYVDVTLLLIKPEDIQLLKDLFNSFHANLGFTVDKFENEVPHVLDIKISAQGLTIFCKNTHTGQYGHYDSLTPWNYKISWIRSLVTRAKRICCVNLLPEEIIEIKKFASWNGFPKSISALIIKRASNKSINDNHTDDDDDIIKFYLNLPYLGRAGEMLVKKSIRTLKKNIKNDVTVTFVVTYNTTKLSIYTNTKDRIDKLAHSYIVYKFCCPGCSKSYICKTERTFFERINEHVFKYKNSVVCNHINNCDGVKYQVDLLNIDQVQTERNKLDSKIYSVTTVKENRQYH